MPGLCANTEQGLQINGGVHSVCLNIIPWQTCFCKGGLLFELQKV